LYLSLSFHHLSERLQHLSSTTIHHMTIASE
jgi:hypothetical protein